jgi:biotin operon repressor
MHLSKFKTRVLIFTFILIIISLAYDLTKNKFPDGYRVGYEEGFNKRQHAEKQFGTSSFNQEKLIQSLEADGFDIEKIKNTEDKSYMTGYRIGMVHGLMKYEKKY